MPFTNPHPLYNVWRSMIDRCTNPKLKQWQDYGGRGIDICERWTLKKVGFHNFVADMGPRPDGYTLDRINNNLGYMPENCRWANRREQQRNRRVTRKVTIDGVEYIAADLSERYGLKTDTIVERAKKGLTFEEVVNPSRRVFYDGLRIGHKYGRGAGKHRQTSMQDRS